MTRTNEVDQSFSPIMSYTPSYNPKVQASRAKYMSYKPKIDNKPCADNNIEVTNNVKNGEGKRYKADVVGKPNKYYEPDVDDTPQAKGAKNTNGVNQDFGADMSYNPNSKETQTKRERNAKKGLVDQSFSPNMSYEPKFSHNQDFGEDMSYKSPTIGEDKPYEHKPSADEKTKKTNQAVREDKSYKPGVKNTKKTNPKAPSMSYKPEVSSTPQAINTNGVNQAFGARMCYSPNIAENTKLTGADMSYIPKIVNEPYFHDK